MTWPSEATGDGVCGSLWWSAKEMLETIRPASKAKCRFIIVISPLLFLLVFSSIILRYYNLNKHLIAGIASASYR
jgi:hypothetical protein